MRSLISKLFLVALVSACTADQEPDPETSQVTGESDVGDNVLGGNFGMALATGDFNCDGWDDIAVGAPGDNAVIIIDGRDGGAMSPAQRLVPQNFGAAGGGMFGQALAAGDLDGDGCTDLLVGAPQYVAANGSKAGAFFIYQGSGSGLHHGVGPTYEMTVGSPEEGDKFGMSFAFGKFDGTHMFIAVGAPGEKPGSNPNINAGWVEVLRYFGPTLVAATVGLSIANENKDAAFGWSMVATDLDSDGKVDLFVGAPGEGSTKSGAVHYYKGSADPNAPLTHNTKLTDSIAPANAGFGTALAVGKYRGTTAKTMLAVGEPTTPDSSAGRVQLYTNTLAFSQTLSFVQNGFVVTNAGLGTSLATGNFNADSAGVDELLVGAPLKNEAVVYLGHSGANMTQWGTREPHNLSSPLFYGQSVAVANHFIPSFDAYDDMVIGAPLTTIQKAGDGVVQIYLGDGSIPNWFQTVSEATD